MMLLVYSMNFVLLFAITICTPLTFSIKFDTSAKTGWPSVYMVVTGDHFQKYCNTSSEDQN